jgi:acylphosphatase
MERRAALRVTGVVQGVNYRYSTKLKADELGLVGTVRNLPDGAVEVVCEGDERAIRGLIEWCRQGPGGAFVDGVDVAWQEPTGRLARFTVLPY